MHPQTLAQRFPEPVHLGILPKGNILVTCRHIQKAGNFRR